MKYTNIYLIRHSKILKIYSEDKFKKDVNLTQEINERIILSVEGEKLAREISNIEELKNIDLIYSSSYVRCLSTAKYIADRNNININIDENFNERKLGNLYQLKKLGSNKKFTFTIEQLIDDNLKNIDGENKKEVLKRFGKSFENILKKHKSKNIAIISHGASIKFFYQNGVN